jgi:hypothetical protein
MAEEKKETWLNWLAITTILFSASATLSTFKGGGYSTKAVLAQSLASDTWNLYQAKSLKQHSYELQHDLLELEAKRPGIPQADVTAKMAAYEKEIARYKEEKIDQKTKAEGLETERKDYQLHGGKFGLAVMFLQVAIMLSALAGLLKKKPLWIVGILFGLAGLVCFVNGFYLFF